MKQKLIECDIVDFNKKGHGIAYAENGIPIEVLHTMPGDKVSALLLRKSRGCYVTKKEALLKESPWRQEPRCKHFGECGGCCWQHVPYEQQLLIKEKNISLLFRDYDVERHPIIPCDPPWEYRNKMQFSFSQNKKGIKFLGLIIPRTKGMVANLDECHLCPSWFTKVLSSVREWWHETELSAFHAPKNTGSLRHITLRGDCFVMLTVSGCAEFALSQKELRSFQDAVQKVLPEASIYLQIQQTAKGMITQFYEMHLAGPEFIKETLHVDNQDFTFRVSPTAFFQPNPRQTEHLYTRALKIANITKEDVVWDLYCGSATLGIIAAPRAKEVIGIEIVPESVLDAKTNIALNNIKNIKVHEGDVGQILKREKLVSPDIVILDPPRAGLDKHALDEILAVAPKKIIYISCNPTTQAANIADFVEGGYRLSVLQPVDMFPMTPHSENIALLEK